MSAIATLENSHISVLQALDDLPESLWDIPGVCNNWSVKDIIAHLSSYELVLADVLKTLQGEAPSPYILRLVQSREDFNQSVVDAHRYQTSQQILNDFEDNQLQTISLLQVTDVDLINRSGTIDWLRSGMSVAQCIDRLAHHTREHVDQIILFRKQQDPIK